MKTTANKISDAVDMLERVKCLLDEVRDGCVADSWNDLDGELSDDLAEHIETIEELQSALDGIGYDVAAHG